MSGIEILKALKLLGHKLLSTILQSGRTLQPGLDAPLQLVQLRPTVSLGGSVSFLTGSRRLGASSSWNITVSPPQTRPLLASFSNKTVSDTIVTPCSQLCLLLSLFFKHTHHLSSSQSSRNKHCCIIWELKKTTISSSANVSCKISSTVRKGSIRVKNVKNQSFGVFSSPEKEQFCCRCHQIPFKV